jgi:UDP-2-acetamido-3-amino-2,3-dideoxy-glucuronate N-acetyltransferase
VNAPLEPQNNHDNQVKLPEEVRLIEFNRITDVRGDLTSIEFMSETPFQPKRIFLITNVPPEFERGSHAHKSCKQLLIVASGSVTVRLNDGKSKEKVMTLSQHKSLYVPSMIWVELVFNSKESVLVVLASESYDPDEYIKSYETFLGLIESFK